jgi:hypothetical protein
MANPPTTNKPKPVTSDIKRLPGRTGGPGKLQTEAVPSQQAQTPLQNPAYTGNVVDFYTWRASQEQGETVIRGDARIYAGVGYTDYLGKYGRIEQPFFENADRAVLMGWQQISENQAALDMLADVYRAHYRKPNDYVPSPNQLLSIYERAAADASTAAANDARITISDVLNSYAAMDVYGIPVGDGSGGRKGPTQFETRRNPADVRILANALAQEMIGRSIDDDEFSRMMRRVRQAESDSPRTVSVQGGTQITEEGISDAERQQVLQEAIMEIPEFAAYQGGEGLIDNLDQGARELQSEMAGL